MSPFKGSRQKANPRLLRLAQYKDSACRSKERRSLTQQAQQGIKDQEADGAIPYEDRSRSGE